MLNDRFIRARAKDFAKRVTGDAGEDPGQQIQRAYQLALSRAASPMELETSLKFLNERAAARIGRSPDGARGLALVDLCHALLCLNEFIYID